MTVMLSNKRNTTGTCSCSNERVLRGRDGSVGIDGLRAGMCLAARTNYN